MPAAEGQRGGAKVEHPFHVAKNHGQLFALFGLADLVLDKRSQPVQRRKVNEAASAPHAVCASALAGRIRGTSPWRNHVHVGRRRLERSLFSASLVTGRFLELP